MTNANDNVNTVTVPGFTYVDGSYEESYISGGLTKREYFAAMAMQGILSGQWLSNAEEVSNDAVIIADALINELNK